ncbi:MAG: isoprenylcysteine carboxylmethyltransferase family protein [Sphingobium sp.]|nr:isoprenylcysteine carboxylmethyltransferase family protein [Sphingobium sp.]
MLLRMFYGLFAGFTYVIFLLTFLYLIAFLAPLPLVPHTVDHGGLVNQPVMAAVVDTLLVMLFACQHSIMARPAFKRVWTRIVPKPIERSAYVLAASLALILLFAFWQPLPTVLWSVEDPFGQGILWGLFALGWAVVLLSTFLISHFELFGLKQVWQHMTGQAQGQTELRQPFLYKLVRHPLYLGFFIAFWSAPVMTFGHMLFALEMSGFMLVAIQFEERDLIDVFGDAYRRYRRSTGMLLPGIGRARS